MDYHYFSFSVFLIQVNYYFQVFFNLNVILFVAKITRNTVTDLL